MKRQRGGARARKRLRDGIEAGLGTGRPRSISSICSGREKSAPAWQVIGVPTSEANPRGRRTNAGNRGWPA